MSIPTDTWTPAPVITAFLAPIDEPYFPLYMRATGGVALNDGSQGREVQFWSIAYSTGGVISVDATNSGEAGYTLSVDGDVLSVCLAFDSNMAVAIAYQKPDGSYLYFFNDQSNQYETLFVPDTTSCRVAVDKTTRFFEGQSDVMFCYVKADDSLGYRIQRERYVTDHPIPDSNALGQTMVRFGPSVDNRLQVQLLPPEAL